MNIVIDIDENMYKDANLLRIKDLPDLRKIIAYGRPLPKGHGRLIDANILLDDYIENEDYDFEEIILYSPTIIEADEESD